MFLAVRKLLEGTLRRVTESWNTGWDQCLMAHLLTEAAGTNLGWRHTDKRQQMYATRPDVVEAMGLLATRVPESFDRGYRPYGDVMKTEGFLVSWNDNQDTPDPIVDMLKAVITEDVPLD